MKDGVNLTPWPGRILMWMQQHAARRIVDTPAIVAGLGEEETSSRLRMALKRLVSTGCVARMGTDVPARWELTKKGRRA